MPPENAFCCKSGPLPLSFCHLLSLLPRTTTYIPLPASGSANPLLTSFLTAKAPNLIYSSADSDEPPALSREFMQSFKAIVQTTRIGFPPSSSTATSQTNSPPTPTFRPAQNEENYFIPPPPPQETNTFPAHPSASRQRKMEEDQQIGCRRMFTIAGERDRGWGWREMGLAGWGGGVVV